jgi:rhodanese-related sulfurtransferase
MKRRTVLGALPALALPANAAARVSKSAQLKSVDQITTEAHAGVRYIAVEELQSRMKANPRLVLLDVRTAREHEGGRIKGAAWVEPGTVEWVLVRQLPDPGAELVVYCKVGHRAGLVVKALRQIGYQNVVGLDGGFDAWALAGNPVQTYLGDFRALNLTPRNAGTSAIDFYADKGGWPPPVK